MDGGAVVLADPISRRRIVVVNSPALAPALGVLLCLLLPSPRRRIAAQPVAA